MCMHFVGLVKHKVLTQAGDIPLSSMCICPETVTIKYNGVEWSKDRTQAAESIKWRPQQAYGSSQVLPAQPQTIFSTPKIFTLTHR